MIFGCKFGCKSAFLTERMARLSLVKRAVSGSWLRDCINKRFNFIFRYKITSRTDSKACPPCAMGVVWAFIEHREGCSTFSYKAIIGSKLQNNPSGFLAKTTSLYQRAAKLRILGLLFVAEIWCKQVVYVQTCGLHRRSMNAPTDLFYKYIYL